MELKYTNSRYKARPLSVYDYFLISISISFLNTSYKNATSEYWKNTSQLPCSENFSPIHQIFFIVYDVKH